MFLFTADIHLTSKASEGYRWELFTWLAARISALKIRHLFILGDLTDAKDSHRSDLVNLFVENLISLEQVKIHILKGNHDYTVADQPFFEFLGGYPRITFYSEPTEKIIAGKKFLILPHTDSWTSYSRKWIKKGYDFIIFHQPLNGALTNNGIEIEGSASPKALINAAPTVASIGGDIHPPQEIAKGVYYTGAPHPLRAGDCFEPRVIVYDGDSIKSVSRMMVRKPSIRIRGYLDQDELMTLLENETYEGDMAFITVEITQPQAHFWKTYSQSIKQVCDSLEINLRSLQLRIIQTDAIDQKITGTSPTDLMTAFNEFRDYSEACKSFAKSVLSGKLNGH